MLDQLRRYVLTGAVLAGVLTSAGCSTAGDTASATPSASASSSSTDLAGALARLGSESARFTMVFGEDQRAGGVIDPVTGHWEMTGNGYVVRRIGADVYVKLTAEPTGSMYPGQYAADLGKWVHVTAPAGGAAFARDFPWTAARTATTADLDVNGRFSRVTTGDMVVSYSDYGTPVVVTAPPASETIEDHLFTIANLGSIF